MTGIVHVSATTGVQEFVGNYTDFRRQYRAPAAVTATARDSDNVRRDRPAHRVKLSYKEQREYDALPERIAALEGEIEALQTSSAAADFYQRPHDEVAAQLDRLAAAMAELDDAYERWDALDSRTPG